MHRQFLSLPFFPLLQDKETIYDSKLQRRKHVRLSEMGERGRAREKRVRKVIYEF